VLTPYYLSRATIDSFVAWNKDLHTFEVSNADWESIKLVTSWLKSFQLATTEMSAMKVPMLSTTHAIFRGLQEDIKSFLRHLPNSVSPQIKLGLVDAHHKLSDYYYWYDEYSASKNCSNVLYIFIVSGVSHEWIILRT
jgi:hypothetical protein